MAVAASLAAICTLVSILQQVQQSTNSLRIPSPFAQKNARSGGSTIYLTEKAIEILAMHPAGPSASVLAALSFAVPCPLLLQQQQQEQQQQLQQREQQLLQQQHPPPPGR